MIAISATDINNSMSVNPLALGFLIGRFIGSSRFLLYLSQFFHR